MDMDTTSIGKSSVAPITFPIFAPISISPAKPRLPKTRRDRNSRCGRGGDFQRTNLSSIRYCAIPPICYIQGIVVRFRRNGREGGCHISKKGGISTYGIVITYSLFGLTNWCTVNCQNVPEWRSWATSNFGFQSTSFTLHPEYCRADGGAMCVETLTIAPAGFVSKIETFCAASSYY